MKKYIFIPLAMAIGVAFSGCSRWLDIQPKVAVAEEHLFSREIGFKEALTGIYVELSGVNLYGRMLTYGYPDHLAQRYVSSLARDATLYEYLTTEPIQIWLNVYNVIANVNNLLAHLETNGDVITTPELRNIMEGEALAIRALLHFDLLRMYGPIYNENPTKAAIPYREEFNRESIPLLPANEVMELVKNDLNRAETLLADDAMVLFADTRYNTNPFLQYRAFRMNLYAVKALLARVYLWEGDKTRAAYYANEVISAQMDGSPMFKLIIDNAADRIYSTEILFAVNMHNFAAQVTSDFSGGRYIITSFQRFYDIFTTAQDGFNDIRVRDGQGFFVATSYVSTMKYEQAASAISCVHVLRLPEMYYIMSECETDPVKSAEWLSKVRKARAISDIEPFANEEDKLNKIEIEYRKEFYGEGQYWFFLKRHFRKTFLGCPVTPEMREIHYCFPIPDDEVILGGISNN